MILVDRPYVSEFLKETAATHRIPIVKTPEAQALGVTEGPHLLEEHEALRWLRSMEVPRLYATSENAIGWIARNLSSTGLPEKIDLFKNKVKFRSILAPLMPDFFYQEVTWNALDSLTLEDMPLPCVIKPAVGFFSMGVYKITALHDWSGIKKSIKADVVKAKELYPREVFDANSFIIEQTIEGEEFAVDAYFDAEGNPVILGIFRHLFATGADVNDRVYITSKDVMEENLAEITRFLDNLGRIVGVRNFPVHAEIRRSETGNFLPIEINPMRFGGWCSTPDLTYLAYGINPYLVYFQQERPDWPRLLKGKAGKRYCLIVLDNATGVDGRDIARFDYERLLDRFERPLEFRKIDYRKYPVFGFLFVETSKENEAELEWVLRSDLKEFIALES